ncbi:hypothetical protein BN1200_120123 [Klebsiella variicola]|nr:hypothetical protein BN1200_120123 [Klebsiella variicola]
MTKHPNMKWSYLFTARIKSILNSCSFQAKRIHILESADTSRHLLLINKVILPTASFCHFDSIGQSE